MALVAPILVIQIGQGEPGKLRPTLSQQHESLRITIRKRTKQHSIHDAEHRAVCPDPQSQRKHSYHGESGVLSQPTERKSKILCETKHPWPPDLGSCEFQTIQIK